MYKCLFLPIFMWQLYLWCRNIWSFACITILCKCEKWFLLVKNIHRSNNILEEILHIIRFKEKEKSIIFFQHVSKLLKRRHYIYIGQPNTSFLDIKKIRLLVNLLRWRFILWELNTPSEIKDTKKYSFYGKSNLWNTDTAMCIVEIQM